MEIVKCVEVLFIHSLVTVVVIFLATLDVLWVVAESGGRIEHVTLLASAESRIAVLQTLEEIAAVVLLWETQVVAKCELRGVRNGRASEAEHLFRHASAALSFVWELAHSRLIQNAVDIRSYKNNV